MKEEPVTIVDRDVLKVLSADTRVDILKELSEGARTPSDLGKRLRKSSATIVEHLDVMAKSGLVKKVEQPGKKWVFYTLTRRGEGIISSKSRRLVIILSVSLLLMFGGIFSLGNYFYYSHQALVASEIAKTPAIIDGVMPRPYPKPDFPVALYLGVALVGAAALGIILYLREKSKYNIRNREEFL